MMALSAILRGRGILRCFSSVVAQPAQTSRFLNAVETMNTEELREKLRTRPEELGLKRARVLNFELPEKTAGNFPERIEDVHRELQYNLRKIQPVKASAHVFDEIPVYVWCENALLGEVSRTKKVSDNEVLIYPDDELQAPMVELAIKKSGLKLEVSRFVGEIRVKLLDNDRETPVRKADEFGQAAKAKVKAILEEQKNSARAAGVNFGDSERVHFGFIDSAVASRKKVLV